MLSLSLSLIISEHYETSDAQKTGPKLDLIIITHISLAWYKYYKGNFTNSCHRFKFHKAEQIFQWNKFFVTGQDQFKAVRRL